MLAGAARKSKATVAGIAAARHRSNPLQTGLRAGAKRKMTTPTAAPTTTSSTTTTTTTTGTTTDTPSETPKAPQWRVATYNLLAPELCSPGYFVNCKPEDCEPSRRYERIEAKLQSEIDRRAIVCLQEVSHSWMGNVHALCAAQNYTYVHDSYGYHFNGYMGVGIAFPNDKYVLEECKVKRIADSKKGGYKEKPPYRSPYNSTIWQRAWRIVSRAMRSLLELLQAPKVDLWHEVERRTNTTVFVRLKDRATDHKLCVATYHMPCAFRTPPVISAHCSLLAKRVNKLAQSDPYVIAGDFNLKPDSPMYELMTKGKFATEESRAEGDMPEPAFPGDAWTMHDGMPQLKSAYAEVRGSEPEFTNLACTRWQTEGTFIETLDYIFYTGQGLRADAVDPLPTRADVEGVASYPSADEPSDHIKIAAEFSTGNKRTEEEKQRRRELYLARKAASESGSEASG